MNRVSQILRLEFLPSAELLPSNHKLSLAAVVKRARMLGRRGYVSRDHFPIDAVIDTVFGGLELKGR
jgi:hypothetical protein